MWIVAEISGIDEKGAPMVRGKTYVSSASDHLFNPHVRIGLFALINTLSHTYTRETHAKIISIISFEIPGMGVYVEPWSDRSDEWPPSPGFMQRQHRHAPRAANTQGRHKFEKSMNLNG